MSHAPIKRDSKVVITQIRRLDGRKAAARFSVRFSSGVELAGCFLQRTEDGRRWTVLPPKIPLLAENNELCFDGADRLLYESALSFKTAEVREHFVSTCLEALWRQHPEVITPRSTKKSA